MQKIQHFVLTRFNLQLSSRFDKDKSGRRTDQDDWLDHRFDLFERFCLPSIAAQRNREFAWLLFFDEHTPQRFRDRVERAKQLCPQIQVFYIPGTNIFDHVMSRVDDDIDVLITTRLDNDDALHENALQVVREQVASAAGNLCVNLRYGLELEISEDAAEVISHKYNPFSSLIEFADRGEFRTIFATAHGKISQIAPVRQVADIPYWMRVLHDRNVSYRKYTDISKIRSGGWKSLRRYIKNALLIKLRRKFWPANLRRKYPLGEIAATFHIDASRLGGADSPGSDHKHP